MKRCFFALCLLVAGLLSACATAPKFDTTGVDFSITPPRAVTENTTLQGTPLLWGGIIIASSNLKQVTQFEILAYPLDGNLRPDTGKQPLGRFLAQQQGYLETADYTAGRLMTVSGTLQGTRIGRIGESEYTYPVLQVKQHYLWSRASEEPDTSVHFGIGVMFHN
jgi:outer membrane lipoprotein